MREVLLVFFKEEKGGGKMGNVKNNKCINHALSVF